MRKIAVGASINSPIGGLPFVVIRTPASVDQEKTSALDALDFVNFITVPTLSEKIETTVNLGRFRIEIGQLLYLVPIY